MLLEVIIVLFLVILNGFFVAAEFSIVKVRASQLEVKTANNKSLATTTKHIMDNLDGYLAATQLGITIASLGLGWLGEDVFSKIVANVFHYFHIELSHALLHTIAGSIAFVFVTFMHVVFGELMPKSIAIRHALPTSITLAYPLYFCYYIFRPFIYVFNGFANFMLNLIGVGAAHGHGESHSEEELRFILQESKKNQEELSDVKKYELIDKVFEFDDKQVLEIMTPRADIMAIDMKWSEDEIYNMVLNNKFSRYPVFERTLDNIMGVLHIQNILQNLRYGKSIDFEEKNFITQAIHAANTMPVGDLLLLLQKKRAHLAIITDEYGNVQGIITLEDIIEELLGEIYDEYDDMDIVHKLGDNTFLVNATAKIVEVNEVLPVPLTIPEGMVFGTVSGLVRFTMKRVPAPGEIVSTENYDISVVHRTKKNKIKVVELKLRNK